MGQTDKKNIFKKNALAFEMFLILNLALSAEVLELCPIH
jgi:hypothetical protein